MQQSVTPGSSSICATAEVDSVGSNEAADRGIAPHADVGADIPATGGNVAPECASVIECHVSTPRYTIKGTMCSVARFAVVRSAIHTAASVNAKTKKRKDIPAAVTTANGKSVGSPKRRQPNATIAMTAYHSRFQLPIK